MAVVQTVFFFLVTLGLLVTIHEFGHFIIARWSGVQVVRFAVGFGPALLQRTDRRGTQFVLGCIPLGGYVRMLDERVVAELGAGQSAALSYPQLSVWWRIAIAFGGPLANFVLAVAAYWLIFVVGATSLAPVIAAPAADSQAAHAGLVAGMEINAIDGRSTQSWQDVNLALAERLGESGVIDVTVRSPDGLTQHVAVAIHDWQKGAAQPDPIGGLGLAVAAPRVLGEVVRASAAQRAGLQPGDRIDAVDGKPITIWHDWQEAIRKAPGLPLRVQITRDDHEMLIALTPDAKTDAQGARYGFAGVAPQLRRISYGPVEAMVRAVRSTGQGIGMTVSMVGKIVTGLISTHNISGPISTARIATAAASAGFEYYIDVLALLSISLGVLNLLPIPVLDGGHILFCTIEILLGRPVPEAIQVWGLQIGLFFVASLMMLAVYNDLTRLF